MTTSVIDQKYVQRFRLLDTDGNGYISKEDYELIIARLTDLYHPEPLVAAELQQRFIRMWHGLQRVADADGDGRVTLEEYLEAVKNGLVHRPDGYDRVVRPAVETVLGLAAASGNGLTCEDVTQLMGAMGVDPEDTRKFFEAVDTDKDGRISSDEFLEADRQFYLSDAAEAPGNLLFGRP